MKSDTERHYYYPLFLDITGKYCVIIGGGAVAARKARMLLKFHASVIVISPKISGKLTLLGEAGKIEIKPRKYQSGDLSNAVIVFACTDDRDVNNKVRRDAAKRGIPVNVVDRPEECDFIVPSIVKKGDVTIAISTSGVLPMASKKIRQTIERTLTGDYIAYVRIIGKLRQYLIRTIPEKTVRARVMRSIASMEMTDIVKTGLKGMKQLVKERLS
ncbi:MAG: precorrin-2 dehydrogenase/sirohydrochlorin ferrochelatase family protein [Syntrophorhabdaceae bacterium]